MDDAVVQRILAAVDAGRVAAFERAIVRIPSFTTEESPLAQFIADYLRAIGGDLEVELQEVPLDDAGGRSHNVVARLSGGAARPGLLLFGHLDHEPAQGREFARLAGWARDPFGGEVEDDWLYGKGSQDDKGGVTSLVMAAEALVRARVPLRGTVVFAGVQGHKRRSTGVLHLLQQGLQADCAVNTENCGNTVVPAFVGRSEGKIHVRAPELHFSLKETFAELRGRRTAFEVLHEIQQALGPEMHPPARDSWMTFTAHPELPGYPQLRLESVEFHGIDHLVLDLQVRTVPGMTGPGIRDDLRRLLAGFERKYPYLTTEVEWPVWEHRSAVAVPRDHAVVRRLAWCHERVTGQPAAVGAHGMLGSAADASHTDAAGIPTIHYGPGGGDTDKEYRLKGYLGEGPPDERVRLSDIVTATKVLALLSVDLCG